MRARIFGCDKYDKAVVVHWFQQRLFAEGIYRPGANEVPTSMSTGTIFNGLHLFDQNDTRAGFI